MDDDDDADDSPDEADEDAVSAWDMEHGEGFEDDELTGGASKSGRRSPFVVVVLIVILGTFIAVTLAAVFRG